MVCCNHNEQDSRMCHTKLGSILNKQMIVIVCSGEIDDGFGMWYHCGEDAVLPDNIEEKSLAVDL